MRPGAGSFSSTCRSAHWPSYWPFSSCRRTAKRLGNGTSTWLGLRCSLPALCSSCMVRTTWASASARSLWRSLLFCLRCSSRRQLAREIGPNRPSIIQGQDLRRRCGHAICVERNLVCGSDADPALSDPRLWPLPKCDRLAVGSSWIGHDLFLSVDGSTYAAIRHSQGICRRSISSSRGDAAVYLARQSRVECRSTRTCSFRAGRRAERGGDPFHLRRIRFGQKT